MGTSQPRFSRLWLVERHPHPAWCSSAQTGLVSWGTWGSGWQEGISLPSALWCRAGEPHSDKHMCEGEKGEMRRGALCAAERCRREEMKMARSRLMSEAGLSPGAMVMPWGGSLRVLEVQSLSSWRGAWQRTGRWDAVAESATCYRQQQVDRPSHLGRFEQKRHQSPLPQRHTSSDRDTPSSTSHILIGAIFFQTTTLCLPSCSSGLGRRRFLTCYILSWNLIEMQIIVI